MTLLHALMTLPPYAVDVIRLALWLLALSFVFILLERLWALRAQKITRKGVLEDLFYYFLNSLLPNIVLTFPLALLAVGIYRVLPWPMQQFVAGLPEWVRLTAVFFVGQVGFYWGHRWTHEIPLLWRFHSLHHSAEELDWLVNTRAHPVDMVFTRLCGFIPIYALGLAQPTANAAGIASVVIALAGTTWGFFIHANLRWRLGPLEWLIATPAFHHWHHTNDSMRDRNYSAMLPWLDRLFGTHHMPRREWPSTYGIDKPIADDLIGQLIDPLLFTLPKHWAPVRVPVIVIGGVVAVGTAVWWNYVLSNRLGIQIGIESLNCLANFGTGHCRRFAFAGVGATNVICALMFYAGVLTSAFGFFIPGRERKTSESRAG